MQNTGSNCCKLLDVLQYLVRFGRKFKGTSHRAGTIPFDVSFVLDTSLASEEEHELIVKAFADTPGSCDVEAMVLLLQGVVDHATAGLQDWTETQALQSRHCNGMARPAGPHRSLLQ
jgi:hypothetical protein